MRRSVFAVTILMCVAIATSSIVPLTPVRAENRIDSRIDSRIEGVYPPGSSPSVSTDKQVYQPGDTVVIVSTGCPVGSVVTFTITPVGGGPSVVLSAVADQTGVATVNYKAATTGDYTVTASCDGKTATTSFTVTSATIPSTGTDVAGVATIATLSVVIGFGLFFVARFRRRPLR